MIEPLLPFASSEVGVSRTGRLLGIARHPARFAPMEVVEAVEVTLAGGIEGDHRGAAKGAPYRRQVTLFPMLVI